MNTPITHYKCAQPGCGNFVSKQGAGCGRPSCVAAADPTLDARDRLRAYMEEKTARMLEISKAKNADYTGASAGDPFANFSRVEALGICSAEVGFLTRMTDKLCRIASFVAKGTLMVKDESVEDTLLDLANYCLLLGAYIAEKRRAQP